MVLSSRDGSRAPEQKHILGQDLGNLGKLQIPTVLCEYSVCRNAKNCFLNEAQIDNLGCKLIHEEAQLHIWS